MNIGTFAIWSALAALHLWSAQPCRASFFEMSLERNSIYTPGRMRLVMGLTDEAAVEARYTVGVNILAQEVLIRNQIVPLTKDAPAVFELDFPETRNRTVVRCRAELSIDGNFIEARERPLLLWPPLAPMQKPPQDETIWVFDTSGALQRILRDLHVNASDATFQAIRDFQIPDIIFVGENVGLKNFDTLSSRILVKDENLKVIVFLRQEESPEAWPVQVLPAGPSPRSVSCDPNSPLLLGLNKLDIMNVLSGAVPMKITRPADKQWSLGSYIGESKENEEKVHSYLAVIRQPGMTRVYCQVPITTHFYEEPRSAVLLKNLLQFGYGECVSPNH